MPASPAPRFAAPGTPSRPLHLLAPDSLEAWLGAQPEALARCVDRVGWHPGGVYVLPDEVIGQTGERLIFQAEVATENTLRQRGTLDCQGVEKRRVSRSKYGVKRPKEAKAAAAK